MNDEEVVISRVLALTCGMTDGRGVAHGKRLSVVAIVDGHLVELVQSGYSPFGKGTINGEPGWILLLRPCPKHGLFTFREEYAIDAINRGQRAMMLTIRSPLKVRRR